MLYERPPSGGLLTGNDGLSFSPAYDVIRVKSSSTVCMVPIYISYDMHFESAFAGAIGWCVVCHVVGVCVYYLRLFGYHLSCKF